MAKKIPQRMCMCCRKTFEKDELIRIVKSGDKIFVDETNKASGRGAYICKSPECLQKFKKSRALNRTFKLNVEEAVYDEVLSLANKIASNSKTASEEVNATK